MKKSINEIQEDIIKTFGLFDDWVDKYEHLIEYGRSLPLIEEKYKIDENIIKGCQSKVWLHADMEGSKVIFTADSDAIITKGIAGLMVKVLSNHAPDEIINAELYFIDKTGLKEHLSPSRSNGLVSMVGQMKMYALACSNKFC